MRRKVRVSVASSGATPLAFVFCYFLFHLCVSLSLLSFQASAYVQVLLDGSVQLAHGGIEMGQGLYTKLTQVCATAMGVPLRDVHVTRTSTDTSANEQPTAASVSSDRYGMAIIDACEQVRGGAWA